MYNRVRFDPWSIYLPDRAPLNDTIITIISRMVDDAGKIPPREPSHSDLEFHIDRCGLSLADPKKQGQTVGKGKRVRTVLSWALENDISKGETLVCSLISQIRGFGGFRVTSPNYIGDDVVEDAIKTFHNEGFTLTRDGVLNPILLDGISGRELTAALRIYVRRAQQSAEDAALVTSTGKDLLEATAAHVLMEKWGSYSAGNNFPTLWGQAFIACGLKTTYQPAQATETYMQRLERSFYEAACAVNTMRNKEGTGHGRPWLPAITDNQAKMAVQLMGMVSELLLDKLDGK